MNSVPFIDVLFFQRGHAGVITLNRPQSLNALTGPMVLAISDQLKIWADDPAVRVIILTGAGERGLCAGGDIRALCNSGKAGDGQAESFWRNEYALNDAIAHYPKPYVALMDGLVMGGGIGLSAHARHRIVTERSKLAMPEVGIGFLPDVGGTWLLSHAPGETGTFLGLTGTTFAGADALYAGFADVLIPSEHLEALIEKLAAVNEGEDVAAILKGAAIQSEPSFLALQRADIDRVFQGDSAEAMIAAANALGTDWSKTIAKTLLERSPTSVKVTLAALRRARKLPSLKACLEMELRAGLHILRGHDFYEGVRAQIIDKDRNPKWQPATLAEIDAATVNAHFDPV
ncbi:enoyl-CoA hydratase/isomerase family protein [Beijerinckia indica]|uniref:3-hydroxyisobutyryl-CoA hydrolase n=1 Tax=Beijerinckia indica subsp. indica (strain ATCC 9039 / DSM 1715 / NCIMB 8712) TaxID=395963 RepID=B2IFQ5_BEII9|nr:enoyl-CoA hydratase/isomerase family protein [Beijerinckia indica]ACB94266.1 Enoyl-CoA hydratase/isomerase [Beijerinckia indica subsp. indica ATCC 9039]